MSRSYKLYDFGSTGPAMWRFAVLVAQCVGGGPIKLLSWEKLKKD